MANTYDVGDQTRVKATFTNSTSTTVDPTAITYKQKSPSGTVTILIYTTDPEVVRSTRGVYYTDVDIDETGTWYARWAGTGACAAAAEHYWLVRKSEF